MRASPFSSLKVHLTASAKATYSYHERSEATQGLNPWNDGSKLGMKAQNLEVKKRVKRALRQLPGANSSNRSMMAHRQGGGG